MKIALVGSRDYPNESAVLSKLEQARAKYGEELVVVSGACATGADAIAERCAKRLGIPLLLFPADWRTHGKAAGPIRNQKIVDAADALIAFWDYGSPGTLNTISLARAKDIPIWIVGLDGTTRRENKGKGTLD
jgi:hypothetical protein